MTNETQNLLAMETSSLLDEFAAGRATPGAGSAAALSGALAAALIVTARKFVAEKAKTIPKYEAVADEANRRGNLARDAAEFLRGYTSQDTLMFQPVIEARTKRDVAKKDNDNPAVQLWDQIAQQKLREATEPLLRVTEQCIDVARHALWFVKNGYQSARGDSSVAASVALAAAEGAIATAALNLRGIKCDEAWKNFASLQLRKSLEIIGQIRLDLLAQFQCQLPQ